LQRQREGGLYRSPNAVRKGDTSPDPLYLEAIEPRLGTNGGTMSDWFHELVIVGNSIRLASEVESGDALG
jgi:hypothetical protein